MDDAHSALLIISIIIVLFVNFSVHSFNSALRELDNSDIEEEDKEVKLRRFLEKKDKVLYCTHIVNILSVSFLGWYFIRTFGSIIKNKLPNTLPVSLSSGISILIVVIIFCILFVGVAAVTKNASSSPFFNAVAASSNERYLTSISLTVSP